VGIPLYGHNGQPRSKHILLLPSLNLPRDDLEEEVRCFLSHRTAGFWDQYQALIDQNDPTTFHIPKDARQEMLDKLRFTTLQLEDSTLREKDPKEIDDTVQAFLNLRPDGFALNVKKQEIAILEFTRAMDTDVQREVRKDAVKRPGTPLSLTSLVPPTNTRVGKCYR